MPATDVLHLLTFAQAELRSVRLVLRDGTEVVGTPSTVDPDPGAYEVFLHPAGDDETEIALSIAEIRTAELLD